MAKIPTTTKISWINATIAQIPKRRLLAGFGIFLKDQVIYIIIKSDAIITAHIAFTVVSAPIVGPIVSNLL